MVIFFEMYFGFLASIYQFKGFYIVAYSFALLSEKELKEKVIDVSIGFETLVKS